MRRIHASERGDFGLSDRLMIGDNGKRFQGGMGENLDTLFITGGLARMETATTDQPDPEKLSAFLAEAQFEPSYAIGMLR